MEVSMCVCCEKNPAMIFEDDGCGLSERMGYCLICARKLNIGSMRQSMNKHGISDEAVDAAIEQFNSKMNDIYNKE